MELTLRYLVLLYKFYKELIKMLKSFPTKQTGNLKPFPVKLQATTQPVEPVKPIEIPKISLWDVIKGIPKALVEVPVEIAKGLYEQMAHPGAEQQNIEKLIGKPKNPVTKYVALPIFKTVTRFLSPIFQPFASDVAEIHEVSRPGGIADLVQQGKLPASTLDEIAVLQKTAPQIVGDVAQTVIATGAGGLFAGAAEKSAAMPVLEALKRGTGEGMKVGLGFGVSQALSQGYDKNLGVTENIATYASTIGTNTSVGGIFGAITSGAIPVTKAIFDKVTKAKEVYNKAVVTPKTPEAKPTVAPETPLKAPETQKMTIKPFPTKKAVIEPLAKEAQKYKTAEEFSDALVWGKLGTKENIKTMQKFREGFRSITGAKGGDTQAAIDFFNQAKGAVKWEVATKKPTPTKPSGVAKSIEAKAIEEKLTKGYKDLTEFESRNFKEEAEKVADLINSGIDNARAVVRGEKPTDIRAGAVIAGMEEYAKAHPLEAAEIIQELANSPLNATISVGASETSFARMREKDAASIRLAEVKRARESKIKDFPKKKTAQTKKLKAETEKLNLAKEETSFNNFLDKIVC